MSENENKSLVTGGSDLIGALIVFGTGFLTGLVGSKIVKPIVNKIKNGTKKLNKEEAIEVSDK